MAKQKKTKGKKSNSMTGAIKQLVVILFLKYFLFGFSLCSFGFAIWRPLDS